MSDDSFDRLMSAVRDGTGTVVLDIEGPHVSASLHAVREMEESRHARIDRGERVAWLYPADHSGEFKPSLDRDWKLCTGVTREQAGALLDAGAKWIGDDFYKP